MRVNIGCPCLFTYYAPPVFAGKARGAVPPRTSCHRRRPQMAPFTDSERYHRQDILGTEDQCARGGRGRDQSRMPLVNQALKVASTPSEQINNTQHTLFTISRAIIRVVYFES